MIKLTVELVPKSCWYENLRSYLDKKDWDLIRKFCYKQAKYRCEICGGVGETHPIECHEKWSYDDINLIQKLEGVIGLCPECHEVKHSGLAISRGRKQKVINQLCKVNNWSVSKSKSYLTSCFTEYHIRSQKKYKVDYSWLEKFLPNHLEYQTKNND